MAPSIRSRWTDDLFEYIVKPIGQEEWPETANKIWMQLAEVEVFGMISSMISLNL